MGEKLLTAKEAAEILKVRKNTVYDMIKRGDLKASKLGKQLRIRQEDLDLYSIWKPIWKPGEYHAK